MEGIELLPTLNHCIEATAREEFWNSANQYMGSGQKDKRLEEKIELLKAFLESADFGKLRSESELHLVQGKKVTFVLRWTEGRPSYEMVVTER
jgi:hypothetical protein